MTIVNQQLWDLAPEDVKQAALAAFAGPLARVLVLFPDDHPKHPGYRISWYGPYQGSQTVATNLDSWL